VLVASFLKADEIRKSSSKAEMGTLRHTAVTNMFDANINQMDIAAITGHNMKSVQTILDRYNKRSERQARRATTQRIIDDGRHSTQ